MIKYQQNILLIFIILTAPFSGFLSLAQENKDFLPSLEELRKEVARLREVDEKNKKLIIQGLEKYKKYLPLIIIFYTTEEKQVADRLKEALAELGVEKNRIQLKPYGRVMFLENRSLEFYVYGADIRLIGKSIVSKGDLKRDVGLFKETYGEFLDELKKPLKVIAEPIVVFDLHYDPSDLKGKKIIHQQAEFLKTIADKYHIRSVIRESESNQYTKFFIWAYRYNGSVLESIIDIPAQGKSSSDIEKEFTLSLKYGFPEKFLHTNKQTMPPVKTLNEQERLEELRKMIKKAFPDNP